jgi:hypothetical protein
MNTPDPRAEARNRANRRLRRMTIATAALGLASVGLLGATAAFTNAGAQTSAGTLALVVSGDAGSTSTDPASATATPSTTTSSSSSSTTTPTVSGTSGTAHASTGGS